MEEQSQTLPHRETSTAAMEGRTREAENPQAIPVP